MKKSFKKKFNLILGTIVFIFLIGSAFAVDWIFGAGFLVGFFISVYNGLVEKNPLIPIFLFVGAWIIRFGLSFLPSVIEAKDLVSLIVSFVLLLVLVISGWRLKKGKWKIWKFRPKKFFRKIPFFTKRKKRNR